MNAKRKEHLEALIKHDQAYWAQGIQIAGVDEVGRGPLAGCVMAACVVMPQHPLVDWVDDSKSLSPGRREAVYEEILEKALFVGIGRAEPDEIDAMNIRQATRLAMRRAAAGCPADLMIVDAEKQVGFSVQEHAILKGDATSYSIAAASIIAKVVRDREMIELSARYPAYGFEENKGYGTAKHMEALRAYGPCPMHRLSFLSRLRSQG